MNKPPTEAEVELARQARNLYYREYRRKHPERVAQINARYWLKRAKQAQERQTADDAK